MQVHKRTGISKFMALAPIKRHLDDNPELPSPKRTRKDLTFEQKLQLIEDSEKFPKFTQTELSKKYGIGRSTVSDILRRKEFFLERYKANKSGNSVYRKRFKEKSKYLEVNEMLYKWFTEARSKNSLISGPILQEKALCFASELGYTEFKASNGWLESWKKRFSGSKFKVSNEKETNEVYNDQLTKLQNCISFRNYDDSSSLENETSTEDRHVVDRNSEQDFSSESMYITYKPENCDNKSDCEPELFYDKNAIHNDENEIQTNEASENDSLPNGLPENVTVKTEMNDSTNETITELAYEKSGIDSYESLLCILQQARKFAIEVDTEYILPVEHLINMTERKIIQNEINCKPQHQI